jgi:RTX calcium-binding nonapeptide repeat (4 copies)
MPARRCRSLAVRTGPTLRLEELAARTLPSAGPIILTPAGVLIIRGTPAADTVTVSPDPGNANLLNVYFNNPVTPAKTIDLSFTAVARMVFRGGAGDDSLTNSTAIPTLARGGAGNDSITTGAGADQLIGGPGDDQLAGGDGNDTARSGAGNDTVSGGAGDDVCFGEIGNDVVDGNEGNDTVRGGLGADLVRGGSGDDHLWGGPGNDQLFGGMGDDWLDGGYGRDGASGGQGTNVVVRGDPGSTGVDLWCNLFDFTSFAIGFAEVTTGVVDGVPHTDVEVFVVDAPPGDPFAICVDVNGDGTQVIDLGEVTADDSGTAILELTDPPGLPALVDGVTILQATDTAPGATLDLTGTVFDPIAIHFMANLANPIDPSGPLWGTADFNASTRRLFLDVGGADPNTTYTVYIGADAATGTQIAEVTTGDNGYGRLQVLADANFPAIEEGTLVTVTTAAGEIILQGELEELSGQ